MNKTFPTPQEMQLLARQGWLRGLGFVFQDVALSQRQEFVLKHVAHRTTRLGLPANSVELAKVLEISTANAGMALNLLVSKGYLTRTDVGAPSGGSLYEYALVEDLVEK